LTDLSENWKSFNTGQNGSGPEFHFNFGSGQVGSLTLLVGFDGSGQELWTDVQLWSQWLSVATVAHSRM